MAIGSVATAECTAKYSMLDQRYLEQLDYAVVGIHKECYQDQGRERNTDNLIACMAYEKVRFISHPDDDHTPLNYERLVSAAKRHSVALELNNSSLLKPDLRLNCVNNYKHILALCMEYGVPIIVMNELTQLEEERDQVVEQADAARDRIKELAPKLKDIESLTRPYLKDPDEVLPQPAALESARTYRDKRALPLLKRILKVLRGLFREFTDLKYKHENLQREYSKELGQSERLRDRIHDLIAENEGLRATARDFDRVCRLFGRDRVTNAVETVKRQENAQIQLQQQSQPRPIRRHQQSL